MSFDEWIDFARRSDQMPGAESLVWRLLEDWVKDHEALVARIHALEMAHDAMHARRGRHEREHEV